MFDESFTLVIDDLEPIKEMLSYGEPTQININDELYVVLSIDEDTSEIEIEPVNYSLTYH